MSRLALQELYFKRALSSHEVTEGLRAQSPQTTRQLAIDTYSAGLPTIALVGPVSDELLQAVGNMLNDFGQTSNIGFYEAPEPERIAT